MKLLREQTAGDLHERFAEAERAFHVEVEDLAAATDARRDAVRSRLAALEAEDQDLQRLSGRLAAT